jgi:predicted metal-dependent hydrolase
MTPATQGRPLLAPDAPLPPYSYVPGRNPHPLSDPTGHMHGRPAERPPAPDPNRWPESRAYLHGLDLFNHGYYWEAHESWEGLWHACGRTGPAADFLRGLIKLAAAGVKVRQGVPEGVAGHAARAAAIFHAAVARLGGVDARLFGLRLGDLLAHARAVEAQAAGAVGDHDAGVRIVFDFVLVPQPAAGA